MLRPSRANVRILTIRRVLRDPPILQSLLITPLLARPRLRLPRPLYPPLPRLIRTRLRLPKLPQKRLIRATKPARRTTQPTTAPHPRRPGERPIVPRADPAPIEVRRTIRHCRRPLAYNHPYVESRNARGRDVARGLDVLTLRHCDVRVREDLVDVRVERDALMGRRGHKAIPVREGLEGVVDEDERVRLLRGAEGEADVPVRVEPVLPSHGEHGGAVKPCWSSETAVSALSTQHIQASRYDLLV